MEKARQLRQDEGKANPLLQELLERARAGREQVITYEGLTVVSPALLQGDLVQALVEEHRHPTSGPRQNTVRAKPGADPPVDGRLLRV